MEVNDIMSLELLDWTDFFDNPVALPLVAMIAGILLAVQAVFSFLLWRKGYKTYFMKFLSFSMISFAIIFAGITYASMGGAFVAAVFIFFLAVPIGVGLQIFIFIRDTWFPGKAEKLFPTDKETTKGKDKKLEVEE